MSTVSYETPVMHLDEALRPAPYDQYNHVSFYEDEAPDFAVEAQRIHAEGYHAMGFVHKDAIQADGTLTPEIDKARGPHVKYYLDYKPESGRDDRAAVRKVNLLEGQTYRDLPAYALCKDHFTPLGETLLDVVDDQENRIKEIGALARTTEAQPRAVYELFRKIIHEAKDTNEVWFMTIVANTHNILVHSYGAKNFISLGENIPIGSQDDRVEDQVELKPVLVRPDKFIDNILESAKNPELRQSERHTLLKNLVFMTDGLKPDEMSDDVRRARQEFMLTQTTVRASRS